jgi:GTPase SAR1 family protein
MGVFVQAVLIMSDSEEEIAERQFKIALVGDPETGKTSIATRYASGNDCLINTNAAFKKID